MDEVSFRVEDDFRESRFAREFAQPLLFGARRGYVGGEAAGVAAARDAAYFGVVARAAVAAGYDYGFSARAAQFLERGGECTAKLILYTHGVEMGQDIIVFST